MTEVLDAPVYPHGVVVGRYLTAVADTTGDPDRLMDFSPATGKVTFTPVSANHIYEGPQPAIITQKAVTCRLDEQGYLTDPNGLRGVHLIIGVYNVTFNIDGAAIPGPQKIQVTESHTLESPLDLVLSAPQIVPPGSVIVIDESTAQRAETAALRAESYVDSLDTKVEEILSNHPELEGPTGIGVENISDTDGDGVALVTYTDGRTSELSLPEGPKGDQGIPGNPSQYILVGPGRPDTPATTGGIITGNEPVGAEYRSTDGANVGAWVWRKRPTGWVVTDGDTGWRNVTSFVVDSTGAAAVASGALRMRRMNDAVYASTFGQRLGMVAGLTGVRVNHPDGFAPVDGGSPWYWGAWDRTALYALFSRPSDWWANSAPMNPFGTGLSPLTSHSWAARNAWPTILPGTVA